MREFYYTYCQPEKHINISQYVYRIGSYHYNWHNEIELMVILNGEVEVCAGGSSWVLKPDDVILINSNTGHATLARKMDSIAMVIHVNPAFLKEYYPDIEYLTFQLVSGPETRQMTEFVKLRCYLAKAMLENGEFGPGGKLHFETCFYKVMDLICRAFPPERNRSAFFRLQQKKIKAIQEMTAFIDKNYKERITLDQLATEWGYNSSYVSQLFRTCLGINFYDYLTRIRLREAVKELTETDKRILDIAAENGFSDLKSFNLKFREMFGKKPTEYRNQVGEEHRKNDASFKKQFLREDDVLVVQRLKSYLEICEDGNWKYQPENIKNEAVTKQLEGKSDQVAKCLRRLVDEMDRVVADMEQLGK